MSEISWYGPAHSAVMYVDTRGVGSKTVRVAASPTGSAEATGSLLTTVQSLGAVTVKATTALRSGWSKQGNTRCASLDSNCE